MPMLKAGEKAPEFKLTTDEGGEIALRDLRGQHVILYFFPKALTPG